MKAGFYMSLAVSGMKKNGRLYVPYLVTCIMMAAVYYILHFLGNDKSVLVNIKKCNFESFILQLFQCVKNSMVFELA